MSTTELQAFYLANLDPQIEALEAALEALDSDDASVPDSLRRVAHQLKGSGTSYGFPEVTEKAKAVLDADDDQLRSVCSDLVTLLHELADRDESMSRVVVVDDDKLMQALLRKVLDEPDRMLVPAMTRTEALVALEEGADLILLDLFLPDADGRDLLAEIRSNPDWAQIPVVVLSGADADLARKESLALGADAFMGKPFDPEALQTLAASLLQIGDPVRHAPAPVAATDPNGNGNGSGTPIVLVAEDDDLVATLIVDRLSRDGFEPIRYRDGESALAAIEESRPDVVILDVKMPRMDGFETLSHVKANPAVSDTPVIVLTAMGSEHDVVRGFALGADDYILKPFSPTELAMRVKRLVEQR